MLGSLLYKGGYARRVKETKSQRRVCFANLADRSRPPLHGWLLVPVQSRQAMTSSIRVAHVRVHTRAMLISNNKNNNKRDRAETRAGTMLLNIVCALWQLGVLAIRSAVGGGGSTARMRTPLPSYALAHQSRN